MDGYALLDAGDGARLERFGDRILDRPHAGAAAPRRDPARWREADLRFDRDAGWSAAGGPAIETWPIETAGLTLELRPTEAGQVGLFPEHRLGLGWLAGAVASRRSEPPTDHPAVLHLFAHTGLSTLALARAGAAVAHVDASRPAVAWARRNAEANDLADRPIRWLVDDAPAFVEREVRRGRRYDGVVLDPPSYGHGARGGRAWVLERDLPPLLQGLRRLLDPDGFLLLTAHTEALDADDLAAIVGAGWRRPATDIERGELILDAESGSRLVLGTFARWDAAR